MGFKLYVGIWACPLVSEALSWPQGGHLVYFVVSLCVKGVFTFGGGGIMYMHDLSFECTKLLFKKNGHLCHSIDHILTYMHVLTSHYLS